MIAIVVAITGSITTISAVFVAARVARRSKLNERRYDAYLRIYEIVSKITTSASNHSLFPGGVLDQDPDRDLERKANIEMLLAGSGKARAAYAEWRAAVFSYWPLVINAATARSKYDRLVETKSQQSADDETNPLSERIDEATTDAEKERLKLIFPMGRIDRATAKLEDVLRGEVLAGTAHRQRASHQANGS